MTARLFSIIQSELFKKGLNEIVDDDGKLIYFDNDKQFTTKILKYDEDVAEIVN